MHVKAGLTDQPTPLVHIPSGVVEAHNIESPLRAEAIFCEGNGVSTVQQYLRGQLVSVWWSQALVNLKTGAKAFSERAIFCATASPNVAWRCITFHKKEKPSGYTVRCYLSGLHSSSGDKNRANHQLCRHISEQQPSWLNTPGPANSCLLKLTLASRNQRAELVLRTRR
ncbi:hypothetical protein RRG08_012553 [Elysia crispata]|uniref:Uncharacterized protein n=1 Tax=Elysia crispata TaxID=231223 RepID=A0AAE1E201_9GAST|nr:hypothetical protein RRG08_012553 [Elysia crispata]